MSTLICNRNVRGIVFFIRVYEQETAGSKYERQTDLEEVTVYAESLEIHGHRQ
jgi:hypothetical protein